MGFSVKYVLGKRNKLQNGYVCSYYSIAQFEQLVKMTGVLEFEGPASIPNSVASMKTSSTLFMVLAEHSMNATAPISFAIFSPCRVQGL